MPEEPEYRYRIWRVDFYEDFPPFDSKVIKPYVSIERLAVRKHTMAGVWLEDGTEKGQWSHEHTFKRFAYPTVEEALESFRRRKCRQISILEAKLTAAREQLEWCNSEKALHQAKEGLKGYVFEDRS